jgi:hypothetical protein
LKHRRSYFCFLHHHDSTFIKVQQTIEIALNKKRMLPILLGALVFVLLGIGMISLVFKARNQIALQAFLCIVGLAAVLFFGLIAIVLLPKMISSKPGMILSDEGLIDNTSGVSVDFIPWHDIRKINFSYSGTHTFVVVMVKKPGKYIERESNIIIRLAMQLNYKISGSPIHILASFLDINLNTLNEMIATKRFQKKLND